jgi:hypothetical protein
MEVPMLRKIAGSCVLVVLASTAPAMAADEHLPRAAVAAGQTVESANRVPALPFEAPNAVGRGSLLSSLYVGLAGLHAYDAYTTLKGVSRGAAESNRMLGGAAGTPAAMWALKGGVTAGAILASERLWRSGRRTQAIAMMVASNAVMAMVGVHNQNVLSGQR